QLQASLVIVEGWRRKVFPLTNDVLHSVMMKGYDSAALILSPASDHNRIQHSLRSLDYERKIAMEYENSSLTFSEIFQCWPGANDDIALLHLTEKNNSLQAQVDSLQAQIDSNIPKLMTEQSAQTDKISLDLLFKDMIKLEEEIAENMEHPSLIENTNEVADFHPPIANSLDAESTV
ncbi:hypothetical protein PENTCL1PPCAC_24713, partial [Pristionchus entomophagus]